MFSEFVNEYQFVHVTEDDHIDLSGYDIVSKSIVEKYTIYKVRNKAYNKTNVIQEPLEISCIHNHPIKYTRINKLPHDNWEELIDCWSCHKSEFKTLRNHQLKIVQGRIFVSDFYCIIPSSDIPECCRGKDESTKFFFNEIIVNRYNTAHIYSFFDEYFKFYNRLFLRLKTRSFEIKYFYDCGVKKDNIKYNAIKIGIKPTDRNEDVTEINDYFREQIEDHLIRNTTNIFVCGYEMAYILLQNDH